MVGRMGFGVLITAAALSTTTVLAAAQVTTATVAGTVKDLQGGVIPGASVTLVSEARGTKLPGVVTNSSGDFVVVNVPADTYTVQVTMSGFKTLKRSAVGVSPGDRVVVPALVIEVGGLEQTVEVRGEAPLIQAQSGERSFIIPTDSVQNLPIASRNFTALAALAPGMNGQNRLGGGGENNVTLDGVGLIATGANSVQLQMNVEAIAEVKVLASSYQAEYGRSSGIQMVAVTKSGTNRIRGSIYDIERNSDWNANSWVNKRNGTPKTVLKEKDWGFSISGPAGRPGGDNKLFFFFSQEWRPRTAGGTISRFRVPTALERQGDFSQSRDNNGSIYNLVRDASTGLPCTAANTSGCFQDGGAIGRIPQNRLYQVGLNVLNLWPLPNDNAGYAATNSYNYVNVSPIVKSHARQEALRGDYQWSARLRLTAKIVQQDASKEPNRADIRFGQASLINGFNDVVETVPRAWQVSGTVNYSINATTFVEASYGAFRNELATTAIRPSSNKNNVGLGSFPMLFPDANIIDPNFYSYRRLTQSGPEYAPWFVDGRSLVPPTFSWGSRIANAPPNIAAYGCCLTENRVPDLSVNLTKVMRRHTVKVGYYWQGNWKPQTAGVGASGPYNGAVSFANDTNNPLDSTFGFANAALGTFTSYGQASRFLEGGYIYNQHDAYVQDNWKVNAKLTLDYGVRFVNQQPQYDSYGFASNFLEQYWDRAQAPVLYRPVCAATPCTGQNLRAQNPLTGQMLGPGSSTAIGQIVANSGNLTNGVFLAGTGPVAKTNYTWPAITVAPRLGYAYDVRGNQRLVLRGGAGVFYDRPSGNTIFGQITNPPASVGVTVINGTLQDLAGGLKLSAPPGMTVFEYESKLPSSVQWNSGVQLALPWSSVVDMEYVGQHGYNLLAPTDINAPDFGAAYLPENQNPTLAPSATPGATTLPVNFYRPFLGYGAINRTMAVGYNWYHSLQTSFTRRFRDGVSFGVNYTFGQAKGTEGTVRITRDANNRVALRSDNDQANYHIQGGDRTHILRANFVWDLPDLRGQGKMLEIAGAVVNDWQLSGVFSAGSGAPYTVGFSYQGIGAVNLTGTPNYNARIVVIGDPGSGCSGDPTRQFNTAALQGPRAGSFGLESGLNYMRSCPDRTLDLAIARNIRLGGGRQIQLRAEMFNALNTVIFTGRNSTMNMASLATNTAATNLPYDAAGQLIAGRDVPRTAGFGVVTGSNAARNVQLQVRFQF